MIDTYRHKGLRKRLIEELRAKKIHDERVLSAMLELPRHFFMEKAFEERAYEDNAFPIAGGQTISQPYTVALQTQLLNVQPEQRILEIGTGSGYQAAILASLGARVYSLERQEILYRNTTQLMLKLGIKKVRTYLRDGYDGLPEMSPFDSILLTAGAEKVPDVLLQQLAVGGVCVVPMGAKNQVMCRITRYSDTDFRTEEFGNFRFVPFLKGIER